MLLLAAENNDSARTETNEGNISAVETDTVKTATTGTAKGISK
jgi:hypothetical protein